MRILLVNSFFPPLTTGSAHFSLDVAREWVRAGHEVAVLTTRVIGAPDEEVLDGVRIVRVPALVVTPGNLAFHYALPFASRPGALRAVRRVFDEVRPDVVHQNGQFFDLTALSTWVAWRRRIPRVLTLHTPLVHTDRWARRLIAAADRTVVRWANAPGRPVLVGVDRFVCELGERRYRPRHGPVRFIPATLRVDRFRDGDGGRVRAALGIGGDPMLLSLGHVIPIRSRLPLVEALPYALKHEPDLRLVVVGEVYDDRFLRRAAELGVDDHVIAVGRVSHREVIDHLAAADVESHELDGHSLGITTLEAMAAGVPVFARADRGLYPGIDLDEWPDLRIVERAGPEEIAEAILGLLRGGDERAQVVREQERFVRRHFRSDVVAGRYLELFASLIGADPSHYDRRP